MSRDEVAKLAQAHGLTKLQPKHLEQLATAVAANDQITRRLPKDLGPTDEMALVLRLTPGKEAGK